MGSTNPIGRRGQIRLALDGGLHWPSALTFLTLLHNLDINISLFVDLNTRRALDAPDGMCWCRVIVLSIQQLSLHSFRHALRIS
jgi:hypothetical protein